MGIKSLWEKKPIYETMCPAFRHARIMNADGGYMAILVEGEK